MSFLIRSRFQGFSSLVKLETNSAKKLTTITLVNSKKRNALSLQAIVQLDDAISKVHKAAKAKQTKILILKGEGPVFSSGHDLKQFAGSKQLAGTVFDRCAKTLLDIRSLPVPTISVVNGVAVAAGLQLALACDMMICSDKSTFSCPGVKWGLFCSTPGVELIRSISSQKKAMQMLMFGEFISAQEAFQYGLANKVVPQEQLEKLVQSYVQKIQHLSAEVIALGKQVFAKQIGKSIEEAYSIGVEGMRKNVNEAKDCEEGLKAFTEKRHPHFQN